MESNLSVPDNKSDISDKLQRTMYSLLEKNVEINNEYLGHLFRHLTEDEDCADPVRLDEDFFIQWIQRAINILNSGETHLPRNIISFAADLISVFIRNEEFFIKLHFAHILEDFVRIIRVIPISEQTEKVHFSYIELLLSFLHHQSGLHWLMASNYWLDAAYMVSQHFSEEINKKSIGFLLKLLEATNRKNKICCRTVISMLLTPLIDIDISRNDNKNGVVFDKVALKDTLYLLNNTFEALLEHSCTAKDFVIINTILDNFDLENCLNNIISIVEDEETLMLLNILLSLVLYSTAARDYDVRNYFTELQWKHFFSTTQKLNDLIFNALVKWKTYYKVLPIVQSTFHFWKYIFDNNQTATVREGRKQRVPAAEVFQSQMVMILLMPLTDVAVKINCNDNGTFEENSGTRSCTAYNYTTLKPIESSTYLFTIEDAIRASTYLRSCFDFFLPCVGNMVIQTLIYKFNDFLNGLKNFQKKTFEKTPSLCNFFDTIVFCLKARDFIWKDVGIENVHLTDVTVEFLNKPIWEPEAFAKGLELLSVAISKNLLPETTDNHLELLEDILLTTLTNVHGEPKFMALQVIQSLVQIANKKFGDYQNMLIRTDIPTMVMKMASQDSMSKVRLKAFQCLQDMILVEEFWKLLLKTKDIYDQLLSCYYKEQEPAVREEALSLIKTVFQFRDIPEGFRKKIFECMLHAIFQDDHKIIKLKALSFWDYIIERQLEHEGMIDGRFPPVTFSKVLKKIVIFDQEAVEEALLRAINRLNNVECLDVLMYIFENESDEDIINSAKKIILKLTELLSEYDVIITSPTSIGSTSGNSKSVLDEDSLASMANDSSSTFHKNSLSKYLKPHSFRTKKNKETAFLQFLKEFDSYYDERRVHSSRTDDLCTVLDKLFIN